MRIGCNAEDIKKQAAKELDIPLCDIVSFEIARESIDSRKKNNIKMIYSADIELSGDEGSVAARFNENKCAKIMHYKYVLPENKRVSKFRPVVVGFGPAGMFCSYMLALAGLRPIIIERGNDVDTRKEDVKTFWKHRNLNTDSNVQFGEGGAGTFSDGKLNTGIKEPRTREVINLFLSFGAPEEIKYSSRPHIGTDKLCDVVKNMRKRIIELGGEVHFGCRLEKLIIANSHIHGITYRDRNGSLADIETDCAVLCIGHSSRDTFESLYAQGVEFTQKAFSVGTRIEHPQELINKVQYGAQFMNKHLGAADYKLSNHPLHGRGGYTFCMCPGGYVVTASSEEGGVVVNGMSEYKRDGENANSAILVGIEPENFESGHPLAGIEMQRKIERSAFFAGGESYSAPAQLVGDFLGGNASKKFASVKPSCPTGVVPGEISACLPAFVCDSIRMAIRNFDTKLKGFAMPEAVLTAPESRSSSPVRIVRDEFLQSNIRGLYPCGEGAGYAGGIVSAAADGIKSAEAVLKDEE